MEPDNQLAYVRHSLALAANIKAVSNDTGVSYDTLMRIKNEPQTGATYETVLILYRHFKRQGRKAVQS